MTAILDILSGPLAQRIGWALVHFLWQGAAVALLLATAWPVLARRGSQLRWAFASAALALMALLPILTACTVTLTPASPAQPLAASRLLPSSPSSPAPVPTRDPKDSKDPGLAIAPTGDPVAPNPLPVSSSLPVPSLHSPVSSSPPPAPSPSSSLHAPGGLGGESPSPSSSWFLPWCLLAWLVGVAALSARHLGGWLLLERTRRLAVRPVPTDLADLFSRLLARMKLTRPVRLLESAAASVPCVVGILRPVILLPAAVLSPVTGLTVHQLEAVLAHELAHVRRHDCLLRLLQAAVETLLFYHPAVWWVSARIRAAGEECCDRAAVAACGDPRSYALALTRLAEFFSQSARSSRLSPAATGPSGGRGLLSRIRGILGLPVRDTLGLRWLVGASVLTVLLALALVVALGPKRPAGSPAAASPRTNPSLKAESVNLAAAHEIDPRATTGPARPASNDLEAARDLLRRSVPGRWTLKDSTTLEGVVPDPARANADLVFRVTYSPSGKALWPPAGIPELVVHGGYGYGEWNGWNRPSPSARNGAAGGFSRTTFPSDATGYPRSTGEMWDDVNAGNATDLGRPFGATPIDMGPPLGPYPGVWDAYDIFRALYYIAPNEGAISGSPPVGPAGFHQVATDFHFALYRKTEGEYLNECKVQNRIIDALRLDPIPLIDQDERLGPPGALSGPAARATSAPGAGATPGIAEWTDAATAAMGFWKRVDLPADKATVTAAGRKGNRLVFREVCWEPLLVAPSPPPGGRLVVQPVAGPAMCQFAVFPADAPSPAGLTEAIPWDADPAPPRQHLRAVYLGRGLGADWYVRATLTEQDRLRDALGLQGGDDRLALLVEGLFVDDEGLTHAQCRRLVARYGDAAIPRLKAAAGRPNGGRAVSVLGAIWTDEATAAIRAFYANEATRESAATALAHGQRRPAARDLYLDMLRRGSWLEMTAGICTQFGWKEALPLLAAAEARPPSLKTAITLLTCRRRLQGRPIDDRVMSTCSMVNVSGSDCNLADARQALLAGADPEASAYVAVALASNRKVRPEDADRVHAAGRDILRELPARSTLPLLTTLAAHVSDDRDRAEYAGLLAWLKAAPATGPTPSPTRHEPPPSP